MSICIAIIRRTKTPRTNLGVLATSSSRRFLTNVVSIALWDLNWKRNYFNTPLKTLNTDNFLAIDPECIGLPDFRYKHLAANRPNIWRSQRFRRGRMSANRILHDRNPTYSASILVAQLQLENMQFRRTSDKNTSDVQNHKQTCRCKPRCRSARTHNPQLQGDTITNSKSPTPEQSRACILTSHRQSDSGTLSPTGGAPDPTCLQNCTDGLQFRLSFGLYHQLNKF